MNSAVENKRESRFTTVNYLLLFGVGGVFGSQFILNKIALEGFSAQTIAASRVVIGITTLTLVLALGFEKLDLSKPKRSFLQWFPDFLLIGMLEATIPFLFITWAQQRLASSVTAVLIGTVPLFATLLEVIFVKGSELPAKKVFGIILGFFGIVVLVTPQFFTPPSSAIPGGFAIILPSLAVLVAALSFATAMLLIRVRFGSELGPIHCAQGILLGSAVTTVPLAIWVSKPWLITSFHPSLQAVVALVLLGVFCGGIVYTLFVVLINRAGPSFASMSNYLVPLTGAVIGIAFSGERLTLALIGSLIMILLSLWLSSGGKKAAAG